MPAMIFISVDLPAPFSPISACTWPRLRRKETLSSASTPGNALRTFSTSSRYSAFGTAPLSRTHCAVVGLSIVRAPERPTPFPPREDGEGRERRRNFSPPRSLRGGGRGWGSSWKPSVLLHKVAHVGWRHQLERNVGLLVDGLAGGERESGVDGALALSGGVLEHRDLQIARLHRGERVLRRVDAADDRLLGVDAGRFHRLQRADRHFVVV